MKILRGTIYSIWSYDEYLEISSGGSVYDQRIGGDTIPSKSYRIRIECVVLMTN